jgi:eukaryotic-like serine/threonine-protein kinase
MMAYQRPQVAEEILANAPLHPAGASMFAVIGMMHATRERWDAAITNYGKIVTVMPGDDAAYHLLAALYVQTSDAENYRRHCDAILARFSGTTNPIVAERCAKDCLILPPQPQQWAALSKLITTAVAEHPDWPYIQFVKGLAEYRQGRAQSAVDWLRKVVAQKGEKYRDVQAHMVLAMAQHRLGQSELARATFANGLAIAQEKFPRGRATVGADSHVNEERFWNRVDAQAGKATLDANWHDWIVSQALMREASALIEK